MDTIENSASIPADYADQIADRESYGSPGDPNLAHNAHSTALGKHQFLAGTWLGFAKANPGLFQGMDTQQILDKRTDPNYSKLGTDWYARYNADILRQHGIAPTAANLGLAHGFGGIGAVGLLSQPDSMKLSDALTATQGQDASTKIMAANPAYLNMTVGQMKNKYAGMSGAGSAPTATPPSPQAPAAPATPAAAATTGAAEYPPALLQMQRLAMLNNALTPRQTAPVSYNTAVNNGPTSWANALLQGPTQSTPLQTVQQLQMLKLLQNGQVNPLLLA